MTGRKSYARVLGKGEVPPLAAHGLKEIAGAAKTAIYNGGSPWDDYWRETITELGRPTTVWETQ